MKRFITFFLVAVMLFSLCACTDSGSGKTDAPQGLQVGYAKINTTPDFSVGLSGYSDEATRKSTGVLSYVYVTCIAATEGDETVLLYTIDMASLYEGDWDMFRSAISPATGVPKDHIFIGATHTHTAPGINSLPDGSKFATLITEKAVEAAKKALEDRAPATIETASAQLEGMNFVRHYLLVDGTYAGPNFGNFDLNLLKEHVHDPDKEMVVVKFNRGGGEKKDVVMVNWQAHPDHSASFGGTLISADYIGYVRDELEKLSGAHVAYFTASNGDMASLSYIPEQNHGLEWDEYGIKLGQYAYEILQKCQPLEAQPGIASTSGMFQVEVDHSWDYMLDQATEVYDLWKVDSAASRPLAKQYGFSSPLQAMWIVSRSRRGQYEERETSAIRIGGLGVICASYEMSSGSGMYIKENSPFKTTFIITSSHGYIPVERAYEYRAYEADTSVYVKGTAEKLADEFVRLLNTVK